MTEIISEEKSPQEEKEEEAFQRSEEKVSKPPKSSEAEIQDGIHNIRKEIESQAAVPERAYKFPL